MRPGDVRGGRAREVLRFGELKIDVESGELWLRDEPVALRPQAARALGALVRRRPRLVPQQQLRREIWGDQAVEWRGGLHQLIRHLRRALGDDAQKPKYIETISRFGYRWIALASPDRLAIGRSRSRAAGFFLAGLATLPIGLLVVCCALAWLG